LLYGFITLTLKFIEAKGTTNDIPPYRFCAAKYVFCAFSGRFFIAKAECARRLKATPRKDRLTALLHICLHIFRHLAQFVLARRQPCVVLIVQFDEKSDCASAQQSLCGVALERTIAMETDSRVAIIAMIIDNDDIIAEVNSLLHTYSTYIVGRMGIPYRERGLNIINIVVDAPNDCISALSGKLGRLNGVTSKAVYSKN
jgi:putative iron-only hydrogenase system regulator